MKSVTLLDAVQWLDLAWEGMKATTISKYFTHCGLSNCSEEKNEKEALPPLEEPCRELQFGALWEEFVQMDNSAETTSTGPINSVATPVEAKTEDQEEEEQELDDEQVITSKQALEHTKALLHFASKAGGEGGSRAGVRLIESSEC